MTKRRTVLFGTLIVLAVWLVAYAFLIRPAFLTWGASAEDQARPLPGDQLGPAGAAPHTRAIAIDAPPEKIWPWLEQIGIGRGGFFSYHWLENVFFANIHNLRARPGDLAPRRDGEFVWSFRPRFLDRSLEAKPGMTGWTFRLTEPGRAYFLDPGWGPFALVPGPAGGTRLFVRSWSSRMKPVGRILMGLFFDPIHFTMERRMMVELKRLAEGRPPAKLLSRIEAWAGFGLAAVLATALILGLGRKRPWILVPALWTVLVVAFTGDLKAALAAYVAFGLIVAFFRVFGRRGWAWIALFWIYVDLVLIYANDAFLVFGWVFLVGSAAALLFLARRGRVAVRSS